MLITGFEPFAGASVNPSAEVVRRLGGEVAPVDGRRIEGWLDEVLARHQPQTVVCLGEARTSPAIRVERVAVNVVDFEIPDAGGWQPAERPVVEGGPAAYLSPLPVRRLRDAMREVGVPAVLSVGAGTYLCNQLYYLVLHRGLQAVFLHLPSLPEQVVGERRPEPSLDLESQVRAVAAALATLR